MTEVHRVPIIKLVYKRNPGSSFAVQLMGERMMNENNNPVWTMPAQEPDEMEIDLLDLMAELLLKWKAILALLLVGAMLGCGAALLMGGGKAEPVTDDAISGAKSQVAGDSATMVEQLFFQYVSYKEYQEDMRTYYGALAAGDINQDNVVLMQAEYYIDSTIQNLDAVFTRTALTEADYQAMRGISPDEEAGAMIYDRVLFTTVYGNGVNVSLDGDENNACVVNVDLYGNSEEQCQKMMAVVDAAFQKKAQELKVADQNLRLESLGTQISHNVKNYVDTLRKSNIDQMTSADAEMTALNTKVNALSKEEKAYYELLKQRYEEPNAVEKRVSWKKFTVIGAFLGALAAAGMVCVVYLLNGKIQSASELEQSCTLLTRVSIQGRKNLFGKLAEFLTHADAVEPETKADMLAADLGILMGKTEKSTLLLMCNSADRDVLQFAEQVKARMQKKNSALQIAVGDPLNSVEELEITARAEMVVAFAELKKSKRAMFQEWRQICARYRVPLAGAVAVQRCW